MDGLTNVSENAGLLPVSLGPARLRETYHTFVHFYNTSAIQRELNLIHNSYGQISRAIDHSHENYTSALHLLKTIGNKILDKSRFLNSGRSKRGIANFIGRGINWLTGNMDDTDKQRLDNMLTNLDKGEISLENQVQNGYSLSNEIINKNRDNLNRIETNEKILARKVQSIAQSAQNSSLSLTYHQQVTEAINYAIDCSLTFLNILTDIETSLMFCTNGQLHPSVITPNNCNKKLN